MADSILCITKDVPVCTWMYLMNCTTSVYMFTSACPKFNILTQLIAIQDIYRGMQMGEKEKGVAACNSFVGVKDLR